MIIYNGKKITATQYAKLAIGDAVSMVEEFWEERDEYNLESEMLTELDKAKIQAAIAKQADRVYRLIKYWELREEI